LITYPELFPGVYPLCYLFVTGHVIPFWKAFDNPNNSMRVDFFNLGINPHLRVARDGTPKEGHNGHFDQNL